MQADTHRSIDPRLCGEPRELREGYSRLRLTVGEEMRADEQGLAHGGFVFGLADHAAMLAVNHPNVVLGSAQVRFVKPVRVDDLLSAEATVAERDGRKWIVTVDVKRRDEIVLRGEFVCFTPEHHVLAGS